MSNKGKKYESCECDCKVKTPKIEEYLFGINEENIEHGRFALNEKETIKKIKNIEDEFDIKFQDMIDSGILTISKINGKDLYIIKYSILRPYKK